MYSCNHARWTSARAVAPHPSHPAVGRKKGGHGASAPLPTWQSGCWIASRGLSSGAHPRDPVARIRQRLQPGHDVEIDYFLLLGLWPAGVLPVANGLTGAAPPFLRFLSAFGFFFSLLLRI